MFSGLIETHWTSSISHFSFVCLKWRHREVKQRTPLTDKNFDFMWVWLASSFSMSIGSSQNSWRHPTGRCIVGRMEDPISWWLELPLSCATASTRRWGSQTRQGFLWWHWSQTRLKAEGRAGHCSKPVPNRSTFHRTLPSYPLRLGPIPLGPQSRGPSGR